MIQCSLSPACSESPGCAALPVRTFESVQRGGIGTRGAPTTEADPAPLKHPVKDPLATLSRPVDKDRNPLRAIIRANLARPKAPMSYAKSGQCPLPPSRTTR